MHVLIQILMVVILYYILKELISSSLNAILIILLVLFIFFIVGGTTNQLQGFMGGIGRFFSKLPTSQFLDLILSTLKSIFDTIVSVFNNA